MHNKTRFQCVENAKFYFLLSVSYEGGVNGAHQANAHSDLAMLGEGSTQAKGLLRSLHKRKALHNSDWPLVLTLKPHNSVSPCISLVTPKSLFFCQSPKLMPASNGFCALAL